MKQTIYLLGICIIYLLPLRLTAQSEQKLTIKEAIVFLSGAELTSTAKVKMAKGENEFLFTNVAGGINTQSLTVGASEGVVVEAATFQNNYLGNEVITKHAKELRDSIEVINDKKQLLNNKLAAINQQLELLESNKKLPVTTQLFLWQN